MDGEGGWEGGVEINWRMYPTSTVLSTQWSVVIRDQALRRWERWFANTGEKESDIMGTGMMSSNFFESFDFRVML